MKVAGVPHDRIITMAADDIAQSEYNPLNGTLYDARTQTDMYPTCKIDYKDITKDRF